MACHGRLAELVLHITNLIYFLSGIAVLTVGGIALGSPSTIVNTFYYVPGIDQLEYIVNIQGIAVGPGIYMTCLGSLVIILSFMGCGGVYKKHKGIIGGYGLMTLLIMLFNIAVIMFYAIDPYFIQPNIESQMNNTLQTYFAPDSISGSSLTLPTQLNAQAWVEMQYEQGCCGVADYTDYQYFTWNNSFSSLGVSQALVPPSCCIGQVSNSVLNFTTQFVNLTQCMLHPPMYTYTQGCSAYVMTQVTRYNMVYCVVAATITGLQAIIIGLTMWSLVVHFEMKFV